MFAIFKTIEEYLTKNNEINSTYGFPNEHGVDSYATETPKQTTDGMYAMQILPSVEHLFADCTIVETVEYP